MLDYAKGYKMNDTYGLTLSKPLAQYDQVSCVWKTYEATLDLDLEMSLPSLPVSGMTCDGLLYELVTLERHTDESDYLSLPTPIAHDAHEPSAASYKRNSPGIAAVIITADNLQLLPTPTVFHTTMHDEEIETFIARQENS